MHAHFHSLIVPVLYLNLTLTLSNWHHNLPHHQGGLKWYTMVCVHVHCNYGAGPLRNAPNESNSKLAWNYLGILMDTGSYFPGDWYRQHSTYTITTKLRQALSLSAYFSMIWKRGAVVKAGVAILAMIWLRWSVFTFLVFIKVPSFFELFCANIAHKMLLLF